MPKTRDIVEQLEKSFAVFQQGEARMRVKRSVLDHEIPSKGRFLRFTAAFTPQHLKRILILFKLLDDKPGRGR